MTTATTPVKIAPVAVRVRPDQLYWWKTDYRWRRGPNTPDGWWMISRQSYVEIEAVRLIVDPEAPERDAREFGRALEDATQADRLAAEDAYLAAVTVTAELSPDDLARLRDAVLEGRAGGPADGSPKARRSRKGTDR